MGLGDLTWLPGAGLTATAVALIAWLVRWIVVTVREDARQRIERERELTATERRRADEATEIARSQQELLERIWWAVAPRSTVYHAGWSGFDGSAPTRTSPPSRHSAGPPSFER